MRALKMITDERRCYNELVVFFNSAEGFSAFGANGDHESWTPERTAIEAMKECIKLRATVRALSKTADIAIGELRHLLPPI